MPLLLGCIADDITGASDLGLMLSSSGLPATLFLGVPDATTEISTPAVVIALKIRTCPAKEAIADGENPCVCGLDDAFVLVDLAHFQRLFNLLGQRID